YLFSESDASDKRDYLRFGRSTDGSFLRFGRDAQQNGDSTSDDVNDDLKRDPIMRFGRGDGFLRFGKGDPFIRFGKRRGDPFIRIGRGDPFIRFGKRDSDASGGQTDKRQDPIIRFGRGDPFIRFGRGDPFIRFGRGDPFIRFGKRQDPFIRFGRGDPFIRFGKRQDPFIRFGRGDPFIRFGRGDPFIRFGRGDPFIRFGKRGADSEEGVGEGEALSRTARSTETTQERANSRQIRSADANKRFMRFGRSATSAFVTQQEAEVKDAVRKRSVENLDNEVKRAMWSNNQQMTRLSKRGHPEFMRFGRSQGDETEDDEIGGDDVISLGEGLAQRVRRVYEDRSSLPRFGKRQEVEEEEEEDVGKEKRQKYMRFGRRSDPEQQASAEVGGAEVPDSVLSAM
ncbi:FMRFamide-related neuropeptides-like, partial [Aplysia californica]|uniref:FMRFamide-related neuropeptides-like n=1 Tax=Aplysia californica TaxID=6500 RepID=A0ABM0JP32_APLCA